MQLMQVLELKILQLVSGGVYDENGLTQYFHQDRYELVMDQSMCVNTLL